MSPVLEVVVAHLDGSATVALVGEFDLTGTEAFRSTVRPLLARYDSSQMTFDCSGLRFLDVRGLRELLACAAGGTEGKVTLAGVNRLVRRLLDITDTTDVFEISAVTPSSSSA